MSIICVKAIAPTKIKNLQKLSSMVMLRYNHNRLTLF